jgi:hypothetical protein
MLHPAILPYKHVGLVAAGLDPSEPSVDQRHITATSIHHGLLGQRRLVPDDLHICTRPGPHRTQRAASTRVAETIRNHGAVQTKPLPLGGHDTDTVERRAIDQLRADDGVDQYVLFQIDGAMNSEGLEE